MKANYKYKKIIGYALASILLYVLFRELLKRDALDFATSVIPGWHISIYPSGWYINLGALILLLMVFLFKGLYRGVNKIIQFLLKKIFPNQE